MIICHQVPTYFLLDVATIKASGEPGQERGGTLSRAKLLGIQLYTGAGVEDSILCQITPTDERSSQSDYEKIPGGII